MLSKRRWGCSGSGSPTTGSRRRSRESSSPLVRGAAAAALLQLLQGSWPIRAQQAGQRAIGEQLSAGLAGGAVVGLVLCVHDALNWRAADGAGLPVAAVDGHVVAECRHLLGEAVADLVPYPRRELEQRRPGGGMQASHLLLAELLRELHRREASRVQDLVGVGVADPAQDARIGQRALEGVTLAEHGRTEA